MQKRTISTSRILYKKYILSWLNPLVLYFLFKLFDFELGFLGYIIWGMVLIYSVILFSLKKVSFTDEHVYFDSSRVDYSEILDLRVVDLNNQPYYIFKTKSKSFFKKYRITQIGLGKGITLIHLLKSLLFKRKTLKETLATTALFQFLHLLEEKSGIKNKLVF